MSGTEERKLIGERLRKARLYLGYTQRYAAEQIGIHRPTLVILEQGKQRCDALTLGKLAKLYQRPVEWFLTESEASYQPPEGIAESFAKLSENDRKEVADFAEFLAGKSHEQG